MAATEGTSVKGSYLFYSCYSAASRVQEQFVHDHALTFILEGSLDFFLGTRHVVYHKGDIVLVKRNQLAKATKIPPVGSAFKSVSLHLYQDMLRMFSMEFGLQASAPWQGESVVQLKPDAFSKSFVDSLTPFMSVDEGSCDNSLVQLKAKEAVLLILRLNPAANDLLFDFSEPGKIDLEEFMSRHFTFNVEMKRFAYLTGRSLATFKRDFEKIFHTSPGKWLQQKRLAQAYYLIKEKKRKPSDVYLEVGFEDLSHFSFAFKKEFGKAPSLLN
jgi:AraC-like DNA-binding protein